MCSYVEEELDLTAILLGSTVVHVKPNVMRFEVTNPDGEKYICRVTIENGEFRVVRDD